MYNTCTLHLVVICTRHSKSIMIYYHNNTQEQTKSAFMHDPIDLPMYDHGSRWQCLLPREFQRHLDNQFVVFRASLCFFPYLCAFVFFKQALAESYTPSGLQQRLIVECQRD